MQVDYYTYKDQDFNCPNCDWNGKGNDLVNTDFHEVSMIGDLNCPKCYNLIAFWQAPLIETNEENNSSKNE